MAENTQKNTESTDDPIKLVSIQELIGKTFFIPGYQRGYRWTKRQVEDLLDDIEEFMEKPRTGNGFYCLQPLVVAGRKITKKDFQDEINRLNALGDGDDIRKGDVTTAIDKLTQWEVIDGQQRLTTIKIILTYLGHKDSYSIEYETRKKDDSSDDIGSQEFLDEIKSYMAEDKKEIADSNIDFFHMRQAYETIQTWFDQKDRQSKRDDFAKALLNDVQFIWYDAKDEDPIELFTRLNIGKISLTNAELIKALFLNRSNWGKETSDTLALSQLEIASQWDNIEYTLRNEEFWMFFHGEDAPPTRIDYIFDYICNKNLLYPTGKGENSPETIGSDKYRTFRYFYNYFYPKVDTKKGGQNLPYAKIKNCWEKVKTIFGTLLEWYNDCEMYHYIGFLVAVNRKDEIDTLLSEWLSGEKCKRNKKTFIQWLKEEITTSISAYKDLTKPYDDGTTQKSKVAPLLLLFNVQTVINQNKGYVGSQQYRLGVFYKFPFHLYKKEKWDIEHIDSNTPNELDSAKDKKEWVLNALLELHYKKGSSAGDTDGSKLDAFQKVKNFLDPGDPETDFEKIQEELKKELGLSGKSDDNALTDVEKNQVWNFALLDSGTNSSYHNDLFPTKRRKLIAKDQGKIISLDWDSDKEAIAIRTQRAEIAFVPPCTRNVFLKYYTPANNDIWSWNKLDAKNYRQAIFDTLSEFGVKIGETQEPQGE